MHLPSRRLRPVRGFKVLFCSYFLPQKQFLQWQPPDLKTDCDYGYDATTCTCDQSEIELASKSCCWGRHCRFAVSYKVNCVTAPVTCLVRYRCPSKSCSVTFSRAPNLRVPPVHNIGSQMTLGLRLLRKPDKWLCFVCFLQHCEPPCTEVFPRHGCLVARGSYEYRLNFLWSCIVASVCSGCNVEVSCAGKPPWSGVHETALLVGGGESHLSRPRVELLREGIWCRCLGQNSAMQLVFVFNLNKRAAVLYHGHFLLKFQTTLQMVRKAGTLLSIPHEFFSLYFYKCARFFFFFRQMLACSMSANWGRERKRTQKVDSKSHVSLSSKTFTAFFMTCTFFQLWSWLFFFFFTFNSVSVFCMRVCC